MAERRTIGQILQGMGRIDEGDVERALEHQRQNGGYFGEALLALGILSPEELEWSLASQFDLPYVFPEADTIDPEAAALVSPEWALAHLALPITKTDSALTVVVDSPMKTRAVEELQARTNREIHLALASANNIRELIRQVYASTATQEPSDQLSSVRLDEGLGLALEAAANRFGISRPWSPRNVLVRRPGHRTTAPPRGSLDRGARPGSCFHRPPHSSAGSPGPRCEPS